MCVNRFILLLVAIGTLIATLVMRGRISYKRFYWISDDFVSLFFLLVSSGGLLTNNKQINKGRLWTIQWCRIALLYYEFRIGRHVVFFLLQLSAIYYVLTNK